MLYQPDWINGREVGRGTRKCAERYETIAAYLRESDLPRGFSVIDLGCYTGYFSRRLHDDFGAECVAVDNQPRLEPTDGVRCIHHHMRPEGILEQPDYDVALCFSALHHHKDWRDYLAALRDRSRILFVEMANPAEDHCPSVRVDAQLLLLDRIGTPIGEYPAGGWNAFWKRTIWVVGQ